ncbi:kinase-like domain-containing protein [Mycena epipterygia]|nr:kinase-like domain-containing protein [Mycena epipterygia]
MDAILGISPSPISTAFTVLRFIVSEIQQVQASKKQLEVLGEAIGQLLETLDAEFKHSRLIATNASKPLRDLNILLEDVHRFVHKEQAAGFFKSLLTKDTRIASIEAFYRRIETVVDGFQISALVNVQVMLARNKAAYKKDKDVLEAQLHALEKNQVDLRATLEISHNNMIAMMVSIQRRLDNLPQSTDPERQFYSHTLQYLSSASGKKVELESWMIPSFEVDYGSEIGAGGFGKVYRGTWNRADVAIKMLQSVGGVAPNVAVLRKEINIWLSLRHPNILQFLGANTLDDKPFIVMPYVPHNARQFLAQRPTVDPIHILCDVSRGLEYLHSRKICHGDLKGLNVLVDASEKALLCDFGLARVKADVTSRSNQEGDSQVLGSRNWMAPELLAGSPVRPASDVYAFGMTIYELYTDENPMSQVAYWDFLEVVFRLGVRPERPDPDDFPKLTDSIWSLAEMCWVKDAKSRPTARHIHDTITNHISAVSMDAEEISTPTNSDNHTSVEADPVESFEIFQPQQKHVPHLSGEELAALHAEVEKQRQTLGDDHPDTLTAMHNFARHCRPKRAQVIAQVVLELRKMVLGEDHPDTLATMAYLGQTYHALGQTIEAKNTSVLVMEKRRVILGKSHPDTLTAMGNVVKVYCALGQYHDAADLGVAVTQEMKRVFGADHLNTLNSMNTLSRVYRQLGRFEEAKEIQLVVVERRKRILGADDPATLLAIHNLGVTYHLLERFEEAMKVQVLAVEGLKSILGGIHPDTLTAMSNLAKTYQHLGKLQDAEELHLTVMVRRKLFLGNHHPETLATMNHLASTCKQQGRTADAKALTEAAEKIRKTIKPQDGPHTSTEVAAQRGTNDLQWPIRFFEDLLGNRLTPRTRQISKTRARE